MTHLDSANCSRLSSRHSFSLDVATALKSADQAIFLSHIAYWLEYNQRTKQNFIEGRYWTYQTLGQLHAHFPYWTIDQLRNVMKKLIEKGILIKGCFNKNSHDRTLWYTLDESKIPKCMWENSQMEMGDFPNRNGESPTCIYKEEDNEIKDNRKKEHAPEKIKFRDEVRLTQDQYDKLLSLHGKDKLDAMMDKLDSQKTATGLKYKDDYGCFKQGGWLLRWYDEQINRPQSPQKQSAIANLKEFATGLKNKFTLNNMEVDINEEGIAFIYTVGQGQPIVIKFRDPGAKEQIENLFRKKGIQKN